MNPYKPIPTDTSMVDLPDYIEELAEKLAENVHENWALQRIRQGWNYGPSGTTRKRKPHAWFPMISCRRKRNFMTAARLLRPSS